jgi:hypothetical protein
MRQHQPSPSHPKVAKHSQKSHGGNLVRRFSATALFGFLFLVAPTSLFAQKMQVFVGDAFFLPPVSVQAQPSYCPVLGTCDVPATTITDRRRLNGWEASVSRQFSPSLTLKVDASGDYGLATSGFPVNGRARQYLLLAGPEFSGHSRIAPFVHVLGGATKQSVSASGNNFLTTFPDEEWGFAAAAGGGMDAKITPRFSIRIIQADYVITHLGGSIQSQPRISIGFLLRF